MPQDGPTQEDFSLLQDRVSNLSALVAALRQRVDELTTESVSGARAEMLAAQHTQEIADLRREVGSLQEEWARARAAMSIIWARIRDTVALVHDKQRVIERTVEQVIRIVNRLSSDNPISLLDTGQLSRSARRAWIVTLSRLIDDAFSINDLRTLAFDVGIDVEDLKWEQKKQLVREIVLYFFHRKQMDVLISVLVSERPLIAWPTSPMDIKLDFDPDAVWRDFMA